MGAMVSRWIGAVVVRANVPRRWRWLDHGRWLASSLSNWLSATAEAWAESGKLTQEGEWNNHSIAPLLRIGRNEKAINASGSSVLVSESQSRDVGPRCKTRIKSSWTLSSQHFSFCTATNMKTNPRGGKELETKAFLVLRYEMALKQSILILLDFSFLLKKLIGWVWFMIAEERGKGTWISPFVDSTQSRDQWRSLKWNEKSTCTAQGQSRIVEDVCRI